MKTEILYDDYLTSDNKQKINKITVDISDNIQMVLSYLEINSNNKICELKIADKIGIAELSEKLSKDNIRELIELLKKIYTQL